MADRQPRPRAPAPALAAAIGGALLLAAAPLAAQSRGGAASDPTLPLDLPSLIERLDPQSRGIRVPAEPAPPTGSGPAAPAPRPAATARAPGTTAAPGAAAASLTVLFATGSAALTPQAEQMLEMLGRAVTSPRLAGYRFRIEGHTDTVGAADMNQSLSERRAAAVRDHLIRSFAVDPARLESVGLGETQLLIRTPDGMPEARNRRVQVVNIGS